MINIYFYKIEATGNDFILIDNRTVDYNITFKDLAKVVCNRHKGVGADGLLIMENSEKYDFKMHYLNSDGSEGMMCGNGGRAIAKYASLVFRKNELKFEALNYVYSAFIENDTVKLYMKNPDRYKNILIDYNDLSIPVYFINTGAPHAVIFWEDLLKFGIDFYNFDLMNFGKFVRFHPFFGKDGTNVDLINIENNTIKIRTYEKGVENETLSCGTGVLAGSIISLLLKKINQPVKVIPKSMDIINVGIDLENNNINNVYIEGKVNIVFKGSLIYDNVNNKIFYDII